MPSGGTRGQRKIVDESGCYDSLQGSVSSAVARAQQNNSSTLRQQSGASRVGNKVNAGTQITKQEYTLN
eukprot:CAMPEP_0185594262 /NCGR_PEP_ID=MMETSP0434-20130131/74250_1 /TAXON_ID=626734 ORGANISM="Favella taraikaensis, Strain Fe Narragansett Bay" /NCGR_SAMPLE_ID=MMETSP0434 /ASSEMBLY_ACC=CAM_ASM_000379 /LENGTH=68 /DNA_ID=CAMNT_0028221441 /DNA_START=2582 /DNA_END=2788 /DNA_ORIENTATION=-